MPSIPDVDFFSYLISTLNISDIEHLLNLCQTYSPTELPVQPDIPDYFSTIIRQVNQLNSNKIELLIIFLEGFVKGIHKQNSASSIISQNTFLVGGQSTINNHVVSQTNSTNLAFNFEPSLLAQAIEKGLVTKSDMKELMDIIGKSLEHRSSPTGDNQSAEQN